MKKLLIFFVLLFFLNTFVSASLINGLASYYNFDSNVGDIALDSNNDSNGVNTNINLITGKIGNCYLFNGSSSYVSLADTNGLKQSASLSVCAWINRKTNNTNDTIFSNYTYPANHKGMMFWLNVTGKLYFDLSDGVSDNEFSGNTALSSVDTWYFVCVTYKYPDVNFYVNGSLDKNNTTSLTSISYASTSFPMIGAYKYSDAHNPFDGNIDELGVWNRALSSSEISDLYNSGTGYVYPFYVPTFNRVDNNSVWKNVDFNLVFVDVNFFDSGKKDANYSLNGGASQTFLFTDNNYYIPFTTDGNFRIDYNFIDNRNSYTSGTVYALRDTNKPTTAWNKDSNSWYKNNQTVSLSCVDSNSGCSSTKYKYKLLPSGFFTALQTYSNPLVFDVDGKWQIDFNSTDVAGNEGDLNTQYLFLDKTKPSITSDVNASWNLLGDANIHLTCSDALSDANKIYYRLDDKNSSDLNWLPWQTYDTNILIGSYLGKQDGNFGLQYYCVDNAGNDSNTGTNYDVNYVLLEQNAPPTPTILTPASGDFTGTLNISCSAPTWIRDYNYSIDYNTSLLDWNNFYSGSSGNALLDLNAMPINEKIWLRCKIMDGDKNSVYKTNTSFISANKDTGFDSITTATPLSPTTIYSTNAVFGVTVSDVSGVKSCTFEVYKNSVKVVDGNGVAPNSDLNNGIWFYTYTNISNGDILFSYVSCIDKEDNVSSKLSSSTYSVSIVSVPPSGGGGGGGETEIKVFEVIYDKPTATLYYGKNRVAKIKFSVKNISSKTIEVIPSASGSIKEYYLVDPTKKNIIEPNTTKEVEYSFLVDDDSTKIDGVLNLVSGNQRFVIPLSMIYDEQRDLLSQLRSFLNFGVDLFGLLIPLWVFIVPPLLFFTIRSKSSRFRNFWFACVVIILFFVFSFEFLNFFGVTL